MKRVLMIGGGILALIAGLVLLVMPGPGLPLIVIGLGMLASEVPIVRKWVTKMIAKLPLSEEKKQKLLKFTQKKGHAH
jgi:hypothetical protein